MRLLIEGGIDPEKLQLPRSKKDKELKFPIEAGSSPKKLVCRRLKYSRELLE